MPDLLGRPLKEALRVLEENGREGQVVYTAAPIRGGGKAVRDGEERVVAVRGDTLIVSTFKTQVNEERHD
ncbi:MAG: hypothetical protein CW338_08045 [Clostridiales bacterium]|nr:hypothetical protein [Clostridiales bacterium]